MSDIMTPRRFTKEEATARRNEKNRAKAAKRARARMTAEEIEAEKIRLDVEISTMIEQRGLTPRIVEGEPTL